MSSSIAIKVESVGKCYQIYDRPEDRLKQSIYPKFQKLSGIQPKYYYREFWALNNISFEIKKGETVGIIGRNGSGKSTLLQIICGTLNPTIGNIEVVGRVAALLELGSGFNPEFTGKENVYLNAAILGLKKEEIDERYQQIIDFADIGDFINQPTKTYSSGMLVRLAFAVIAHVSADVLVIDEAFAVGDIFFVQKCMRFLREFMEFGTLVFVSHDINSIKNLCSRVIWLDKGGLREIGFAKEVSEKYLESALTDNFPQKNNSIEYSDKSIGAIQTQKIYKDQRMKYLNSSNLRNDLQVFSMNSNARSFGLGGVTITLVEFRGEDNMPLNWIVGGEKVSLILEIVANINIDSPIIGFFIKDKLGQYLFGDNTWLTISDSSPKPLMASGRIYVNFSFYMPLLLPGDYSVDVAVADGTPDNHNHHKWINDALTFKSISSSISGSVIGIPMEKIEITYF